MPSFIPLLLALGYAVLALRLHRRWEPFPYSPGMALVTFWFLFCGSRSLGFWLDPGASTDTPIDYLAGNPFDRTILTAAILIGIVILAARKIDFAAVWADNRWLLLLFLLMGVSVIWSNFPEVSIKRWFRGLGDLTMVLIVLSESSPALALQAVFRTGFYFLIPLSVVLIKYFRQIGVVYNVDGSAMWIGVTTHKNSLGQLAAVGAVFTLWSLLRRDGDRPTPVTLKVCDLLLLAMCLWLFSGPSASVSTTSLVTLLFGAVLLFMAMNPRTDSRRFKLLLLSVFLVAALLQGVLYLTANQSLYSLFLQAVGKNPTLTGRTDLWAALIDIGNRNPFLGTGFGGFWIGNVGNSLWEEDQFGWGPEASHNGYIDVYIDLGLVGVLLLAGFLWVSLRRKLVQFDDDKGWGKLKFTLFSMILLFNFSESGFTRPTNFLWFVLLLLTVSLPCHPLAGPRPVAR